MTSKYSVLIEAKLKDKTLQKSIELASKTENPIFTINNIIISKTAIASAKEQLEKGLSNIKVNVDAEGTKEVGKKISANISEAGTTGKTVSTNFEQIQLAIANSNKQLELMSVQSSKAFNTEKVKDSVNILKQHQTELSNNTISMQKFNGQMALTNKEFQIAKTEITNITSNGMGMIQMFEVALKKILLWGAGTMVIYGLKRQLDEMQQYVVDLNKEMTNIQIVNGANSESIKQLALDYNTLAKEMGVTTLEVAKGSLAWIRQGKTAEETSQLLKASLVVSKLANMDSAQATEYLTSIMNGFKLQVNDMIPAIDKLVALDNNYATSVAEIATAMQRSSNVSQQMGVSFDELAGYIK